MLAPTARGVEAVSGGVSHPAHGSPYGEARGGDAEREDTATQVSSCRSPQILKFT